MENRGFTLVELLAVILIVFLLTAIASVVVTRVVKNSKEDLYQTQLKAIESAAESWVSDHPNNLPTDDTCAYLILKDLQDYGLIEKDVKDVRTNEDIPNTLKIKVTHEGSTNNLTTYRYEADVDVSECYPLAE